MEKIYNSKFMKGLQRFGENLASIKGFSAITKAFMGSVGIILVGAIFQIIATIPTLLNWTSVGSDIYNFLMLPHNMTMGMLSVVIVFLLSYNYAKALGIKPLLNAVIGLLMFLLVAAPANTVMLADGKSMFTGLDTSSLGAVGMFTAIIVGIVSVRITYFCEKNKIVIQMGESVPQFLADSFSVLIPMLINVIIWYGLSTLIKNVFGMTLPMAITMLLSSPLAALNTIPGLIIVFIFMTLLWTFGIHGSMIAFIALMPLIIGDLQSNAAAVAAGNPPVFYPSLLFGAATCAGGTGNTFGLVLLGLKSKSQQIKAVSRAALIPGIFNVNEPATFGYPIMYNPVLAIPYILTPIATMLVVWGGYAIGFFQPAYVTIMSLMPLGVGEFFSSLAWQNIFIPVIGIILGVLIYFPFLKLYEWQLVEKEANAKASAETDDKSARKAESKTAVL